jgi:hypothetical protein
MMQVPSGASRDRRASRILVSAVLAVAFTALLAPHAAAAGGPLVLMGIDAEDMGLGGHGPIVNYVDVVNSILSNTTNGGDGILVIGGGKFATDNVTEFWDAIGTGTGETITYVNGTAIGTQSFAGFQMLGIVSSESVTPSGGLTDPENDELVARQDEVGAFVNNGGGLLGLSQTGLSQPYGYLADVGSFTFDTGLGYSDINPTPAGEAISVDNDLDVCCWHDDFISWPSFLDVLAFNTDQGHDQHAAALGGTAVVVGGQPRGGGHTGGGGGGGDGGGGTVRAAQGPEKKTLTLEASPKKVKKGKATDLKGTIAPCTEKTRNDVIEFKKGQETIATLAVDQLCQARLRRAVRRAADFQAFSPADSDSTEATSNVEKVGVKKKKAKGKGKGQRQREGERQSEGERQREGQRFVEGDTFSATRS